MDHTHFRFDGHINRVFHADVIEHIAARLHSNQIPLLIHWWMVANVTEVIALVIEEREPHSELRVDPHFSGLPRVNFDAPGAVIYFQLNGPGYWKCFVEGAGLAGANAAAYRKYRNQNCGEN